MRHSYFHAPSPPLRQTTVRGEQQRRCRATPAAMRRRLASPTPRSALRAHAARTASQARLHHRRAALPTRRPTSAWRCATSASRARTKTSRARVHARNAVTATSALMALPHPSLPAAILGLTCLASLPARTTASTALPATHARVAHRSQRSACRATSRLCRDPRPSVRSVPSATPAPSKRQRGRPPVKR